MPSLRKSTIVAKNYVRNQVGTLYQSPFPILATLFIGVVMFKEFGAKLQKRIVGLFFEGFIVGALLASIIILLVVHDYKGPRYK